MIIRDVDTEEEMVRIIFTYHSEKLIIGADVCPWLAILICLVLRHLSFLSYRNMLSLVIAKMGDVFNAL